MVSFACSQKGHEAFSAFTGHFIICGFSQFTDAFISELVL